MVLCLGMLALWATPASAGSQFFEAKVQNPNCAANGGKYGYGKVTATAYFQELGSIASLQKWNGSNWVGWSPSTKAKSTTFPNDSTSYYWTHGWKYSFSASEVGSKYRLKFVYEYWDQRSGPDYRVGKLTRHGPGCIA
jgi:hypothetical protein